MRLKISDIPEDHSSFSGTLSIGSEEEESLDVKGTAIACTVEIDRLGAQITFQIAFSGVVELRCSRCLAPFERDVRGGFVLLHDGKPQARGNDDEEDEDARTYISDDWIDVGAAVRDEVLTDLPMKPLCSEDCGGGDFAPAQGSDVTIDEEDEKSIDPRWGPLAKLKGK